MKKKAMTGLSFLILIFLLLPFTATAKEIKTLSQFPMSGPTGSLPEFGWGFIDGMNWVNKEGGGVNGKSVKWYLEDMRYSPTVEVANFNKYAAEHDPSELDEAARVGRAAGVDVGRFHGPARGAIAGPGLGIRRLRLATDRGHR